MNQNNAIQTNEGNNSDDRALTATVAEPELLPEPRIEKPDHELDGLEKSKRLLDLTWRILHLMSDTTDKFKQFEALAIQVAETRYPRMKKDQNDFLGISRRVHGYKIRKRNNDVDERISDSEVVEVVE
jgi:hypothetical protein